MINLGFNRREKAAVYGAALFIALFVLIQLVIVPVFNKRDSLGRKLEAKQESLAEIKRLQAEYQQLQQQMSASRKRFESRPRGFTLFSFLDRLAGETGVKRNVTYMKPSSSVSEKSGLTLSRVEMELQDISLKAFTKYLFHVETSENMVEVKRLSISRKGRDNASIDAVLQVETLEASNS